MKTAKIVGALSLAVVLLVGLARVPLPTARGQATVASFLFSAENRNDTVKRAQEVLKDLGYYNGSISGLFGVKTRAAILAFQQAVGLTQNGILDIPTQRRLFSTSVSVHPAPEEGEDYTLLPYTHRGNAYLFEWIGFQHGQSGEAVELNGYLTSSQGGNFLFTTDSIAYVFENVSSVPLEPFLNKYITVQGFSLESIEGSSYPHVFAYVTEDESEEFPTFIAYNQNGNDYLERWISRAYLENGESIFISGTISFSEEETRYGTAGRFTNMLLTTPEGEVYSIENISSFSLNRLDGQVVYLRGYLLAHENSLGHRTVVINYLPSR